MATRISQVSGNFNDAAIWRLVQATADIGTPYLDSEAASTSLSTTPTDSQTFQWTTTAPTIDGIAVKIASRLASPTGTITITLRNVTLLSDVASVTINVSDIDNLQSANQGWYFFRFAAPQTLLVVTSYAVRAVCSVVNEVSLYRDGTAGNWSRMLRTTTTGAPAANDQLHVLGEHTGAGAGNSFTVTMNNTATTSFGPTVSGGPPQGITVGKRATLDLATAASTNYYLKWKGMLAVFSGGTLNLGTSGTPLPSTSTAVFEMDSVANVDTGLELREGSTFNFYGATKTTVKTLLNTDEAAAQTVIGVASTSGWANGDELSFAPTTRTASEAEKKTISTVDSATQVTLTAGLTNAHSGTSPTQAEVANLTRNIKIRGVSATLCGYIRAYSTGTVAGQYIEFTQLGSATANKRGIDVATTTGSFNMQYCSIHDCTVASSLGLNCNSSTNNNITFSNNVTYNIANQHLLTAATTGTSLTFDNNLFTRNTDAGTDLVTLNDAGGTFTNNTMTGATGRGLTIQDVVSYGTITGNTQHGNGSNGLRLSGSSSLTDVTIGTNTVWRNSLDGITIGLPFYRLTFDTLTSFGNATGNLTFTSSCLFIINNGTFNGDTTFSTARGLNFSTGALFIKGQLNNCDFGTAAGIKTTHSTADINVLGACLYEIDMYNTILASGTEVGNQSTMIAGSYIRSQKHDQTAGNHRSWFKYGNIVINTATFRTASPSEALSPTNASNKLESGRKKVAVANGQTVSPTAYVNKAASYTGAQPRLILKKNIPLGINADTVLATASGGTGSWLTLTGTTAAATDDGVFEFLVDCDTNSTVFVDDWSVA